MRRARLPLYILPPLLGAFTAVLAQPYVNVQVNERLNDPEETSIAINPSDPSNVIGVAQYPCRYYYSFDAGLTWDEGDLPDPFDLGDPAIAFDRAGNAYYCYIGTFSHSGIFINRSTDGGVSWMPAGIAIVEHNGSIPFEDKSYHVCDWTNGPYRNSVYVAWTRFSEYGSPDPADSSVILFSRSRNFAHSFSAPMRISDQGGDAVDSDNTVEGAVPAVGPDGTVYVAWSGPRGIELDRSTDGGVSFGRDRVISDQPGGWDFDVPGIGRSNGLPVTKVDQSFGPHRGRVYVNWSDQRNGDTDIFLIYSDDGGQSFAPRVRVNDDPIGNGAHQFFTWMDVDAVTGFVYVLFYDRRAYPPGSTNTDVYLAISEDGGASFTNLGISETPFGPGAIFFGDYTGISAFAGRVRPLWTRSDSPEDLSIWTALIDREGASVAEAIDPRGRAVAYPNPLRTHATIAFLGAALVPSALSVIDPSGRTVRVLRSREARAGTPGFDWDGRNARGERVAPGIYLVSAPGVRPIKVSVLR